MLRNASGAGGLVVGVVNARACGLDVRAGVGTEASLAERSGGNEHLSRRSDGRCEQSET
jgi:hypothetical protein